MARAGVGLFRPVSLDPLSPMYVCRYQAGPVAVEQSQTAELLQCRCFSAVRWRPVPCVLFSATASAVYCLLFCIVCAELRFDVTIALAYRSVLYHILLAAAVYVIYVIKSQNLYRRVCGVNSDGG